MADTTKIYENIFIKKNAAGDREYIKVPYAILADPPTIPDVSGFMPKSGGTFTGEVTFNKKINLGQGDANCLYLGSDGRLNGPENRTLFGLVSGSTTFGHQAYSLRFRGSATRPQYTTDGSNYKDLALKSDIPAAVTESTVSGWGFTKNKGTVTSVAVKMNGTNKGTVTSSGMIDLGTVLTSHQDISGKANLSGGNEFVDGGNTFKGIGGTTQISGSNVWLQAVGAQGSASLVVETGNKNEVFKVEADSDNGIIYINRAISIEGDTGTSGQVLTSQGLGNAPAWTTLPKFSLSGTTLTITL